MKSRPKSLFPGGVNFTSHSGWIYLVGINDGSVKVGRTGNPRERLYDYWRTHSDAFGWAHLFGGGNRRFGSLAEKMAIEALSAKAVRQHGRERFYGVGKETSIVLVRYAIEQARAQVIQEETAREMALAMHRRIRRKIERAAA